MGPALTTALISVVLIIANGVFVAAEFSLIGSRRSRIEQMAKRGNASAKLVLDSLDNLARYVAGIQVGLTLCSVGIASLAEPLISDSLAHLLGNSVPKAVSYTSSLILVTFALVIVGELLPKYLILTDPERAILRLIRILRGVATILRPLVWVAERSTAGILRLLGKSMSENEEESVTKDELLLMVRSGVSDGQWDENHAKLVQKALKFDVLDAGDIMIHRMDIKWVDVTATKERIMQVLQKDKHSRLPVCRDHIDDIVGILYLQDLLQAWSAPEFDLNAILRPVEIVPENLNLNRLVQRMREAKTQILIVADEYGGTSGLVTLEDVVEEVFGELDDAPESDRAAIDRTGPHRLSIRADVRYDELLEFLEIEPDQIEKTDTVAQILVDKLSKVPKLGDRVEDPLGTFRVENMARRRITRVALQLSSSSDKERLS